jgi:membrane-bound serine protease (ClpP class)
MASFFGLVARLVARSHGLKPVVGQEALIGQIGRAKTELNPDGTVWLESALWEATVEGGPVAAGERVEVVRVDGLHLTVRPAVDAASAGSSSGGDPVATTGA